MLLKQHIRAFFLLSLLAASAAFPALAETCSTAPEMEATARAALEQAARQYFQMAANGDVFNLKQNAISDLSRNFSGVEQAVAANRKSLAGATATLRAAYLLDASEATTATLPRAEFYCGIFNTPERAGFVLNNLPRGRYAVVIQDVDGKPPMTLSLILQDLSGWKLAGFYIRTREANGHDGNWYWNQAKQYAAKGQKHNAWLYFVQARDLLAPVPFMSSVPLDKLYDDTQAAIPSDFPANGPVTVTGSDGKSYQITAAFPLVLEDGLAVVMRQQIPDAGDSTAAFQANMGFMKAAVAKWPELRDAFTSMVARAQDAAGHDYGSLLKMTEIK